MRDLNDGRAGIVEPFEKLHDFVALRGVQVAGGLVGENQFRIHDHGASDTYELLLPAGKLIGKQILLAHDVEAIQSIANAADALFMRDVLVGKGHFEILKYREIVDQVIALKDKPNVGFVQFIAFFDVEPVNGLTIEVEFAGPGAIEHSDDAEQRGFSCAGRAHDGDKFARLNIQIDAAQKKEAVRPRLHGFFKVSQLNLWFQEISLRLLVIHNAKRPADRHARRGAPAHSKPTAPPTASPDSR